ncbi:MAG: hypothetical protein HGA80_06430 [Candidatus Omnitrophica bacterium]|nr:hypothetical protein [Candidatus Omnitrophota bacterium]
MKIYGGCIRYLHSTESLLDLLDLAREAAPKNIVACCGSGDQALVLSSLLPVSGRLYAFDSNPAQLFLLAAKARHLSSAIRPPYWLSLEQLTALYPGCVVPVKPDMRKLDRVFDIKDRAYRDLPKEFSSRFVLEVDAVCCTRRQPVWATDKILLKKIKTRLNRLFLVREDVFYLYEWFPDNAVDLLYLSDIAVASGHCYYREKLARLMRLVRSGGFIIGSLDRGEKFLGSGMPLIEMAKDLVPGLSLETVRVQEGLLALRKK